MITIEEEIAVVRAMAHLGGSFVQALATAYTFADPQNRAIIREFWLHYWADYKEKAKLIEARLPEPDSETDSGLG